MSNVSDVMASTQTAAMGEAQGTSDGSKTSKIPGKTIGKPQLSEKGAKYYEELRKKYGNMDFILVSSDMKEAAKANAASYANPNKPVVLIDEEKIERMATDEKFRKQYEGIIANGASQLSQMAKKLAASGANVKGFGMEVKDGRASFFAAVDKSFTAQSARQQKRIAEKKAAKKAEAKKEAKKAAETKRKEKIEEKRAEKADVKEEDVEVITANSIDDLMRKVDDFAYARMSDNIWTKDELKVGQNVDFSL